MQYDYEKMRAELEALENTRFVGSNFSAEDDKLLLEFWDKKKHFEVAGILGKCKSSCLKRYRELTEGK